MYDVHTKTAPKRLLNKFAKISTKHHYNTRYDLQRNVSVSNSLELKKLMKKSFTRTSVSL